MQAQYYWIMCELIAGAAMDVSIVLIALAVYINRKRLNEFLVKWEDEHIFARFREFKRKLHIKIANKLKSNERFMAWLEKPRKHGRPDDEWIAGQIKVWHDWRG